MDVIHIGLRVRGEGAHCPALMTSQLTNQWQMRAKQVNSWS